MIPYTLNAERVLALYAKGLSTYVIAARFGCSRTRIHTFLKQRGLEPNISGGHAFGLLESSLTPKRCRTTGLGD